MSKITNNDVQWFESNFELIRLLRQDSPPTPESVIASRNIIWDSGNELDENLFSHIIEFAIRHEIKCREEYSAYPVLASFLKAEIIAGPNNPDLRLEDGSPVEVKIDDFNQAALTQLLRYMKKYDADRGVACGNKLTVKLPKNIEFVKINFNSKTNAYEVSIGKEVL